MRVNSTIEGPEHTVYDRDYLIDYTSPERNDLAEYNVGHYQWQSTKPVHDLKYLYTADGQRLEVDALHYSQWGGSDTRYTLNIHEDILGSATAYTYQGGWNDGQWANKHEFDVWGYNSKSPTYNYDPMYRSTEPYFTGHPFDGSLNIYYADARFYDAETGTWLSPDPIKDGRNWYAYCGNNPVTFVDFTGLFADNYFTNLAGSDFEGDYTLYVNGKKMTVSRLRYDLRTDKDKDQITLLKEAGLISGEKEYNEQKDDYKWLTVGDIAKLARAENTISTWKESEEEMIMVFNPAMKDQGVRLTRYGANVTIEVNVSFSGDVDATLTPGGKALAQLMIEGFKGWEGTYQAQEKNGIVYDRFGVYDAVNVKVNVQETDINAVNVVLRDNRKERLPLHEIEESTSDLMLGQNISKVIPHGEWAINNLGEMLIYTNERRIAGATDEEKRDTYCWTDIEYNNYELSTEEYISTSTHELGHLLGLGDAYGPNRIEASDEILHENWPAGSVMWKNGSVTSNVVEMVLEASKLNKQQDFLLDNLSPVIRLGMD